MIHARERTRERSGENVDVKKTKYIYGLTHSTLSKAEKIE